jgi:hypothetical protein
MEKQSLQISLKNIIFSLIKIKALFIQINYVIFRIKR